MIDRLRFSLAKLLCPDHVILTEDEAARMFQMITYREPDALFVDEDGDVFEFVLDRSAN